MASTGRATVCASRHGPSAAVNCNRSAMAASSSLAPTGILIPSEPNMLIPTPATGNTRVHARANRTGSNSGRSAPVTAEYAAVNSSSIVTVEPSLHRAGAQTDISS